MATNLSCERSRSTHRELPTMGKQLVTFITCGRVNADLIDDKISPDWNRWLDELDSWIT
jgi:hypothetical protein